MLDVISIDIAMVAINYDAGIFRYFTRSLSSAGTWIAAIYKELWAG